MVLVSGGTLDAPPPRINAPPVMTVGQNFRRSVLSSRVIRTICVLYVVFLNITR